MLSRSYFVNHLCLCSQKKFCTHCWSNKLQRYWKSRWKQRYRCLKCDSIFIPKKLDWVSESYNGYAMQRQTYSNLSDELWLDPKTIRKYFCKIPQHTWELPILKADSRISTIIDATYFGSRSDWLVIARSHTSLNLTHKFIESESSESMSLFLDDYEDAGYIKNTVSFTVDWRKLMIKLLERRYPGIPIQMCLFHMKSIIKRYITLSPKTRLWKALNILKKLLWCVKEKSFVRIFETLECKYADFLKSKNTNWKYEHRRLRSTMRSIRYYMPYLHTYSKHTSLFIPRTTSHCDWYFSHLKWKLEIHRWISRQNRNKVIIYMLEEQNRKTKDLV